MKLPYLSEDNAKQQLVVQEFKGYDHRDPIGAERFYDTLNLSARKYPAACTRSPRGTLPYPALTKPHGLCWADGLYWADGTGLYKDGTKVAGVADSDKQIVRMGAYLYIWPDKVRYHTTLGKLEQLEASWTGTADITENSIEAGGISGFERYDGVTISGAGNEGNNKTAIVQGVESGKLVFSDLCFEPESGVRLTLKREVPDLCHLCELDNRLWGVTAEGHEIRASKLGDPKNWNCYEGISTDSYAVTVGSGGAFTAATSLQGYALLMKEGIVHKMYGTKPSNYQAISQKVRGPMEGAAASLAEVDEVLFYLSRDGVLAYVGASPERIGWPLGEVKYGEAVGGGINGKYYLSARRLGSQEWDLLCYDVARQCWYREDGTHALYFAAGGGKLYYIDGADKRLKTIEGEDAGALPWAFETGDMTEGVPEHKVLTRVILDLTLEAGTRCTVFLRYDGGEWETVRTVEAIGKRRSVPIPIIPRRYERFAVKAQGTGEMTLWAVERTVEGGSEL